MPEEISDPVAIGIALILVLGACALILGGALAAKWIRWEV